ncbi:flagellar hook protein [Campylobacter vicugnae]|uniref:flagellin N-terminal helical domain-containing protein n=1 Tax=Campylobacter vicugnae TaxID=1660076 RepID=UPI000A34607D|nr:flagellar hook protein [Campylobacter sp. RM8835]
MRITNQLMNFTNVYNYQKNSSTLYQSQQAFSSGLKIQHSYEGSAIYVDAARLEYEGNLLKQVETSTLKATEFSKNSDQALNDFVLKLTEFKTKLIQAANDIHDATSRNAIANDLEGIKQNLIDIANTTINGQYLFSGTALDTKPIDTLGNYHGNDQSIKAVIGPNQTSQYNIDGKTLFTGNDNDYKKILTTNVSLVNNLNALRYPDQAVKYIELEDDLRDLIGGNYQSDELNKVDPMDPEDSFNLNKFQDLEHTTFFMQGRRPDGTTFSTKVTMTPDATIESLLKNIGYALGNDKEGKNQLVEVTMNNSGQIEIKDVRSGNKMTDLHIFGLTEKKATEKYTIGGVEINIDPASADKYNIITSVNQNGQQTIVIMDVANAIPYIFTPKADGGFTINNQDIGINAGAGPFAVNLDDFNQAVAIDDFKPFDPNDAEQVRSMSSTGVRNEQGEWKNANELTSLDNIEENVKNGRVHLTEFIKSGFEDPQGVKNDATDYNKLQFEAKSNVLESSVPQVIQGSNEYATDATKLSQVAGGGLQTDKDSNMTMHIKSKNGNHYEVKINFTDPLSSSTPPATSLKISQINPNGTQITPQPVVVYEGNVMLGVYNEATKETDGVATSANDITFKQINDIVSMVAAGNMPQDNISNRVNANLNSVLANINGGVGAGNAPANANDLQTALKNGINDPAVAAIIDRAVIDANITFPLNQAALGSVKDNIINNTEYATARFEAYNTASKAANQTVHTELDYRGKMVVTDKSTSATDIEVSIFETFEDDRSDFAAGADSTQAGALFNFTANNMISIDEPSVDIFKDLDDMIAAVREGSYRGNPNGTDARTTGIQGALKRIDHIQDHVNKLHTQIGSFTNVLESSGTRANMMFVNIESVKSDIIGADLGETMLIYKQQLMQFEAMLQTSSMIGKISLLNYM